MKPRFQHECASCTFLGFINKYDLYTCTKGGKEFPTFVARHGSKRWEYVSGDRITIDGIVLQVSAGWDPS